MLTLVWIILYLFFYKFSIRLPSVKLLFILLTLLHYASFIAILHSYLVLHKLSSNEPLHAMHSPLVLALLYLVSLPPLYWLINRNMAPVITGSIENKYWNYLWLVPATFCLAYYYTLATNGGVALYSANPANVAFAVVFNLGAMFVTFLVLRFVAETKNVLLLKAENYWLSMQSIQYQRLTARMEEAMRAKHDLRQNMTVIMAYLKDQNYIGLEQYLKSYIDNLPSETTIQYCSDYALNALLIYYASIAHNCDILFNVSIDAPINSYITEADAVVLFGNLLENAVEACRRQTTPSPALSLMVTKNHEILAIQLENSHSHDVRPSGELFLSSKTNRPGIGISSVREIVSRYNGTLDFQYDSHSFCARLLLNRQDKH